LLGREAAAQVGKFRKQMLVIYGDKVRGRGHALCAQ
jgi:hypothetical protein